MNNRLSTIAIHVLGCLTFLALPYIFASNGLAKLAELPNNPHEQRNLISYLLTIVFFYTNYYVLIPRLFFHRKYVLYALASVGCFLLIESTLVAINRQGIGSPVRRQPPPIDDRMGHRPLPPFPNGPRPPFPSDHFPEPGSQPSGLPSELSQTFFLTLVGFLMALAIRVNNRWRETEQEKIQTELSYLKAQINPHFLFNTLNSIYSLAIIESPPTADAIVKLSSFLRYVIQESEKNLVSLRNELDYVGQYISLQKLRLGDTVQIDFSVEGNANGKQIVPLLLISFIENAFKYGVSPEEPSGIQIVIAIKDAELHCYVANKKVRVFQPTAVASGIGLTNTKARLQLLYPERHRLVISDKPDSFTVDLSITLS
ncbi:sensor histidine kinase [Spirosoma sp. HMF4905]|uniref:Sensor histidine kinase n=1 Tax=Spirosoma arboris TaxID=2682092 RepID=A0A7K1SIU8_9BACT|nr:sensor histidine kinase [Spirosoma arboris]MVM33654.1 sensor histidine kinase [Spirosoma arboris]